jgi:hypothetical protein
MDPPGPFLVLRAMADEKCCHPAAPRKARSHFLSNRRCNRHSDMTEPPKKNNPTSTSQRDTPRRPNLASRPDRNERRADVAHRLEQTREMFKAIPSFGQVAPQFIGLRPIGFMRERADGIWPRFLMLNEPRVPLCQQRADHTVKHPENEARDRHSPAFTWAPDLWTHLMQSVAGEPEQGVIRFQRFSQRTLRRRKPRDRDAGRQLNIEAPGQPRLGVRRDQLSLPRRNCSALSRALSRR